MAGISEDIIARYLKIKALAERGDAGEKASAQDILKKMQETYEGIDDVIKGLGAGKKATGSAILDEIFAQLRDPAFIGSLIATGTTLLKQARADAERDAKFANVIGRKVDIDAGMDDAETFLICVSITIKNAKGIAKQISEGEMPAFVGAIADEVAAELLPFLLDPKGYAEENLEDDDSE